MKCQTYMTMMTLNKRRAHGLSTNGYLYITVSEAMCQQLYTLSFPWDYNIPHESLHSTEILNASVIFTNAND